MCFKFDAWCCFGPGPDQEDDYYKPTAKAVVPPHHYTLPAKTAEPAQRNGGHQHGVVAHHANGHRAPLHHQQLPQAAAADEEDHKDSNDDARRGGHGYGFAAGAAYVYSGPQDAVKKQMGRNATKVVVPDRERHDAAPYFLYPSQGGDTAACHRYYPATASTASIADYGRF